MPVNFSGRYFRKNLNQLNRILKNEVHLVDFPGHDLNREGKVKGRLVGGNLSILYSLQATPYELDTKGKILFIEDVGEHLYHLDRIFNNLKLSGKLIDLKGLIAGSFTEMKDKKRPFGKNAEEVILEYVDDLDIPVAFGFPAGHSPNNVPFILGVDVEMTVQKDNSIIRYM
jgi:muramoyltetrapeptide carboxypeptidase